MATLQSITVTRADNELIAMAVPVGGQASIELFHLKTGGNPALNYTLTNTDILPAGNYELVLVGVNWGGPATFDVTVNFTTPPATVLAFTQPNPGIGAVWVPKPIPFTI